MNVRHCTWTILFSSLMALTTAACTAGSDPVEPSEQEFASDDDEITHGTSEKDYPEVVYVNIQIPNDDGTFGIWDCNGVAVAPKVVLTAAHCISTFKREKYKMAVRAPLNSKNPGHLYGIKEARALDDVFVEDDIPNWRGRRDIGVLILNEALNLPRYASIASPPNSGALQSGTEVVAFGRYGDGEFTPGKVFKSPVVKLNNTLNNVVRNGTSTENKLFAYAYAIAPVTVEAGDNGGPVMRRGTHQVIGVNSLPIYENNHTTSVKSDDNTVTTYEGVVSDNGTLIPGVFQRAKAIARADLPGVIAFVNNAIRDSKSL